MLRNAFTIALVAAMVSAKNNKNNGNAASRSNLSEDEEFMGWVAQNNKDFIDADDMAKRKGNWKENKAKVAELREKFPKTQFAVNYMADWTDDERAALLGAKIDEAEGRRLEALSHPFEGRKLQGTGDINWANTPYMGPVKNQGQCGSCWSFNATSVLEGVKSIKDSNAAGSLVGPRRISEQEGVDCSDSFGNGGCNGGWPSNYWGWVNSVGGAVQYSDYPYAMRDQPCADMTGKEKIVNVQSSSGFIRGFDNILAALQDGPLSMAVWVDDQRAWYDYSGGIFPEAACAAGTQVNHAVVLVGYESGQSQTIPGETTCTAATADQWVDPVESVCTPGTWVEATEDVYVPATPDTVVPGTEDEWVEGTGDYCRNSKRRERRRNRCNDSTYFLTEDERYCCLPGEPGYWIPGEEGYTIPGEAAYTIPGTPGYWVDGIAETCTEAEAGYTIAGTPEECVTAPDTIIEGGDAAWVVQNSWGTGWGVDGFIRLPVDKEDIGYGACLSQMYIQKVGAF